MQRLVVKHTFLEFQDGEALRICRRNARSAPPGHTDRISVLAQWSQSAHRTPSKSRTLVVSSNIEDATALKCNGSINNISIHHEICAKPEKRKAIAVKGDTLKLKEQCITTLMLRKLDTRCTRELLMQTLELMGFAGLFNFLYMPMHLGTKVNFGYAFINCIGPKESESLIEQLCGRYGRMICVPADIQGLDQCLNRFRNSPIMHESVPDECKPVMLNSGDRVPFPKPTTIIKPPRIRRSKDLIFMDD